MRAISRKTVYRAALIVAAALGTAALSGCYYDDYGYTSLSVRSGGYGHYRNYNPAPYWGWRGDYYYPGVGVYVYDRDRRPHRWNDDDRRYWEGRRDGWGGDHRSGDGNWNDFDGRGGGDNREWRGDDSRGRGDNADWRRGDGGQVRGDNADWRRGDGGQVRGDNTDRRRGDGGQSRGDNADRRRGDDGQGRGDGDDGRVRRGGRD